jgi:hypothetical protein
VRLVISRVIRIVRSRVLPPAPYVTDTKSGFNGTNASREAQSRSSPARSFGGKNSTENVGLPDIRGEGTVAPWFCRA